MKWKDEKKTNKAADRIVQRCKNVKIAECNEKGNCLANKIRRNLRTVIIRMLLNVSIWLA